MPSLRTRAAALDPRIRQLLKFALVGGLGTLTNLVLFYLLVDAAIFGAVEPLAGAAVCFAIAVTQNYAFNELWTFRVEATDGRGNGNEVPEALSFDRYAKFVAASLVGFAINGVVLVGLLAVRDFPLALIPQAIGIVAGMAFNFVASRALVFRR